MRPLSNRAAWILKFIMENKGPVGLCWSSGALAVRRTLVKYGLIRDKVFTVTELGEQTVCALEFDRGLAEGYRLYCDWIDSEMEKTHEEALEDDLRRDVEAGLRYRPDENLDQIVRNIIWAKVCKLGP